MTSSARRQPNPDINHSAVAQGGLFDSTDDGGDGVREDHESNTSSIIQMHGGTADHRKRALERDQELPEKSAHPDMPIRRVHPPEPPDAEIQQPMLRPTEVARILKIGRSTVYLMCQRGELPCVSINRSVRIPTSALKEWVDRHTHVPIEEPSGR
jgi:excisionase family DNA binding protein